MRRSMSTKATKSFSQAGNKRVVNVRISNGSTAITKKATIKKK